VSSVDENAPVGRDVQSQAPRFEFNGNYVVKAIGACNCSAGASASLYGHEPYCGYEPVLSAKALAELGFVQRNQLLDEVSDALLAQRDGLQMFESNTKDGRRYGLEEGARIARSLKSDGAA
jgi:hypothetical protein